jgi:hypothetical protein
MSVVFEEVVERINIYVHVHDLVSEEVHHGMWRIKGPALII